MKVQYSRRGGRPLKPANQISQLLPKSESYGAVDLLCLLCRSSLEELGNHLVLARAHDIQQTYRFFLSNELSAVDKFC